MKETRDGNKFCSPVPRFSINPPGKTFIKIIRKKKSRHPHPHHPRPPPLPHTHTRTCMNFKIERQTLRGASCREKYPLQR